MKRMILLLLVFVTNTLHAEVIAPNGSKRFENYRTSWIGNSYGGLNPETGKGQWVQQDIAAICVTPDGTVYTNVPWEEGGGNCMMYKDGKMLGHAGHTHGWGFNGGKAVAVNDKYVYIALRGNNEGGGLVDADTWPPKGSDWHGVSRRLRGAPGEAPTKGAPFDHGKGGKGDTLPKSFLVVNEVPVAETETGYITGLWADDEKLYVSNPLENRIEIYDAESMKKLAAWPLPETFKGKAGPIAMDPDGNLWMLPHGLLTDSEDVAEWFVVFDRQGKLTSKNISFSPPDESKNTHPVSVVPSAFCFDNEGRLLVADAGTLLSIIVFNKNGSDYVAAEWGIGWPGVSQIRQGIYDDFVFRNITAIGCDAEGNVYVASDWSTNGGGTILESYASTSESADVNSPLMKSLGLSPKVVESWSRRKLNWRLYGLCFIDCATLDPDDETVAYTKEERYKIDWSKEPGKEWTFLGSTAFRPNSVFMTSGLPDNGEFLYRDPRLNIKDSGPVWVRNLGGKKFLFVGDMNSTRLQVYDLHAKDDKIPVEAKVLFSPQHYKLRDGSEPVDWLPGQPKKGEWIWTNSDAPFESEDEFVSALSDTLALMQSTLGRYSQTAELAMSQEEFSSREEEAPRIEGWCIEPKGDIWQATLDKGLRRFLYQGLDKIGNPIWNFEHMELFPHPAEFKQVKRIRYIPETDMLYLGGCATIDGVEHKNQHWKPMGPVICRYDNFLKGEKKLRWKTVLPYVSGSKGHESCEPMGFDVAGDYIFVPYTGASKESGFKTGHVEVLRADDASPVGWMEPDPKTVGEIGLQDMRECISAHKRKNGEYVIFLEDDYKAKVVMYRLAASDPDAIPNGKP